MKPTKPITKHFISTMLQGFFWLLPAIAILIIFSWLYQKITHLINSAFKMIGFIPESHALMWAALMILTFLIIFYLIGWLVKTKIAKLISYLFSKIPGYSTIEGLINIFNSSKEGNNRVLVVGIKGFATEGYNIGLMYSQKESLLKNHYTVTLSMSPIPNGGYMFEVHQDQIFVIENASFDDNLQYLLSMGIKSLTEILKREPAEVSSFLKLSDWLAQNKIEKSKGIE
jgi:uncharacterized membrane protein